MARIKLSCLITVVLVVVFASQASAATITVDTVANTTGGLDCSLRDAITSANNDSGLGGCASGSGADTIDFSLPDPSVIDLGSDLGTALPSVNSDLTIEGPGPEGLTIGSPTPNTLNFTILTQVEGDLDVFGVTLQGASRSGFTGGGFHQVSSSTGSLIIDNVVVIGNTSDCAGGMRMEGGGEITITDSVVTANTGNSCTGAISITTEPTATATIENTSITGNSSPDNGAMYNQAPTSIINSTIANNSSSGNTGVMTNFGNLTVINSTFTGNSAAGNVGVLNTGAGNVVVNNSTIAGNSAGGASGGIAQTGGTVSISNSILADNSAGTTSPDCSGTLTSFGYNLIESTSGCTIDGDATGNVIGEDPMLGALADNGGLTETMALGVGSPALGAGNPGPVDGLLDGPLRHCEPDDQRELPRTQGSCDIGAWQQQLPAFDVSPVSHDFGAIEVGSTSAANTFTVTNTGGADLEISDASITGTDAGQFEATTNECDNVTLTPSDTCDVVVRFSPTSAGSKSASLTFTDDAAGSPHTAGLSGSGQVTPGPTPPSPSPAPPVEPAPTLTQLSISAKKPRKPTKNLTFKFVLSESSTVNVLIQRKYGRKDREACKRTKARTRLKKRCPLYRDVMSESKSMPAGSGLIKISTGALDPGAYRVTLVATNAAGVSSAPARGIFYRPWW